MPASLDEFANVALSLPNRVELDAGRLYRQIIEGPKDDEVIRVFFVLPVSILFLLLSNEIVTGAPTAFCVAGQDAVID